MTGIITELSPCWEGTQEQRPRESDCRVFDEDDWGTHMDHLGDLSQAIAEMSADGARTNTL